MNKPGQDPLYFIAILPPENIRSEIKLFKEKIKTNHNVKHALKLPAHITLQIPFRISDEQKSQLLRKLTLFAQNVDPFKVALDGFGRFSKNVIFVKVSDHIPFIRLYADLREMMNILTNLKSHEISSKIHPHLTIAVRDLKRSNFSEIWQNFENKSYSNSFVAKSLVLLKHNGKTWDIIQEFDFK